MTAAGHFGGVIEAVFVVNDYMYFGSGYELNIIDISNPADPSPVGSLLLFRPIERLTVVGNYAYVATGNIGLTIVNISNPAAPSMVSFINTPGFAFDVAVANNIAYVADDASGIRVINVASPGNPI
ncbi:MAG: hypothetical protein GWN30_08845, partial [Gammaproteobacteria bacterium]|nr:hypothetical protein [Gammaproteobacteria bacterium]